MGAALTFLDHYRGRRLEFFATRAAKRRAQSEARVSQRNPVASSINLDCEREMFHRIVDWKAMPDFDADTQERMDNGDVAARAAADNLREMGYELVETEGPMQPFRRAKDGKVIYTGRLDFKIDFGGRRIPVEVKDVNQHVFEAVDHFEDLGRWFWTRRYQCQVLVYCLQNNEPEGLLLLTCQGRKKWLAVVLEEHLDLAEAALKAGEHVVAAAEAGEAPAFTKDPAACRRCWAFGSVCQPPVTEQGAAILESPELYQALVERDENEAAHRRYEAADKRAKAMLKAAGVTLGICGDFGITSKSYPRKAYEVKATTVTSYEIIRASAAGSKEVA
jgi:hypothetical protein